MTSNFSKEVKEYVNLATPAISFFALPANKQIEMLPTLKKKQKYDFPDGDWITDNALEVLIFSYKACLNRLFIRLMVMLDEDESEHLGVENSEGLVEELLDTTFTIIEDRLKEIGNANSLNSHEWRELRQLSQMLQQQLQIELEVDSAVISNFMDDWLHF